MHEVLEAYLVAQRLDGKYFGKKIEKFPWNRLELPNMDILSIKNIYLYPTDIVIIIENCKFEQLKLLFELESTIYSIEDSPQSINLRVHINGSPEELVHQLNRLEQNLLELVPTI